MRKPNPTKIMTWTSWKPGEKEIDKFNTTFKMSQTVRKFSPVLLFSPSYQITHCSFSIISLEHNDMVTQQRWGL